MDANNVRNKGKIAKQHIDDLFEWLGDCVSKEQQKKQHIGYLKDPNVLTKQEIGEIRSFWAPYEKKPSLVYFAYYKEKTGLFSPNFMPHDYYYRHVDAYYNRLSAAEYLDNKCLYHSMFSGLNMPEEIVYRRHGMYFDGGDRPVSKEDAYRRILAQPRTFLKVASDSLGGFGVFCCDGEASEERLRRWFEGSFDFVAQLPLTQHERIAALHPDSINSMRIMSLLEPRGVTFLSSALRMGQGGKVVDNASSGGIFCGIDADGCLKKYAYTKKGQRFDTHPSTGIPFEGYRIPSFDKALQMVEAAHLRVPEFRLVAWDICIADNGEPVLIEGNFCRAGIFVQQLSGGPLFGDRTKEILDIVQKAETR